MNHLALTPTERQNIEAGPWFSKLSPSLREAIVARSTVRRYPGGMQLTARGQAAHEWCGVASGAVRVSLTPQA